MFVFTLMQSRTLVDTVQAVFRKLNQLKAHLLESHNEGTWFTCDICQQQFITHRKLKLHSVGHHEEGVKQ